MTVTATVHWNPRAMVARRTKAKIIKNRMGPPLRVAEFDIYFDSGVDDFSV